MDGYVISPRAARKTCADLGPLSIQDRHVWDIPFDQFVPTAKIAMTAKLVFTSAATFTRLSLHCFYYRLIQDTGKVWFKWLIHINVAYTIAIWISFIFIGVFLCTPVSAYWDLAAPEGSCVDEGIATLVCGIISCVADFATTMTPLPLVLGVRCLVAGIPMYLANT
jgi:hypothetical protein